MSGGHWNYMSSRLEETAKSSGEVWRLLAIIEHELDWGYCNDTCLSCAEKRCIKAIAAFFDSQCDNASIAMSIAKDREQNCCIKCGGSI